MLAQGHLNNSEKNGITYSESEMIGIIDVAGRFVAFLEAAPAVPLRERRS